MQKIMYFLHMFKLNSCASSNSKDNNKILRMYYQMKRNDKCSKLIFAYRIGGIY
jgi:hypothetical protein